MKKLFTTAVIAGILSILCVCAYAEVGDINGTIYMTDILTRVDGLYIESYAIDGETLIALEDLADYGFTVYYNDNVRSLFVTKTGEARPNFVPTVERQSVGGVRGYTYETDIKAYLNGEPIEGYAIDGKIVAKVETMGAAVQNVNNIGYGGYKTHNYMMSYTYDDENRLLSLNTSLSDFGNFQEAAGYYLTDRDLPWEAYLCDSIHTDDVWLIKKTMGGLPHGNSYTFLPIVYSSGLCFDFWDILLAYGLTFSDPVFSEDGSRLYFKNHYTSGDQSLFDYKQAELSSMHIYPLDESEYNAAASRIRESDFDLYINITGESAKTGDDGYMIQPTVSADGAKVPLYNVGGRDYVRLCDLNGNGFMVSEDKTAEIITILSNSENVGSAQNETPTLDGSVEFVPLGDLTVYINGELLSNTANVLFTYGGEYYIALDALGERLTKTNYLSDLYRMLFYGYNTYGGYAELVGYNVEPQLDIPEESGTVFSGQCGDVYVNATQYEYEYTGGSEPETRAAYTVYVISDEGAATNIMPYVLSYIHNVGDSYTDNKGSINIWYDESLNALKLYFSQNGKTYMFNLETYTVSEV